MKHIFKNTKDYNNNTRKPLRDYKGPTICGLEDVPFYVDEAYYSHLSKIDYRGSTYCGKEDVLYSLSQFTSYTTNTTETQTDVEFAMPLTKNPYNGVLEFITCMECLNHPDIKLFTLDLIDHEYINILYDE